MLKFSLIAFICPFIVAAQDTAASTGFLGGLNLAGFEFGIGTNGEVTGQYVVPDASQVAHFASQGVNVFRVPFGWQYMEKTLGAGLDQDSLSKYDAFVQQALQAATSPYVILDLHNYGRRDGAIVGQANGPTSDQFAALWGALAKKYAGSSKIMFGLMNEPHDLEMNTFKASLQAAVNSIRAAGASSQYILLPGTEWSHASSYISANKGALTGITDPAGGTDKLIMDLHQYLDSDESGRSTECVDDLVAKVWEPVAADLRASKRRAIITEIGGGSTDSCKKHLNSALASIKKNADVYLGFTAWASGQFAEGYELSLTPKGDADTPIWTAAIKPNLPAGSTAGQRRIRLVRRIYA